jgi:hypothetical protein
LTAAVESRGGSRLARLARGSEPAAPPQAEELCEFCGEPIPAEHRHLIDLEKRELKCACRACVILFDRREAGGSHYRLLPERRLRIDGFKLDEEVWAELQIPVEMAFFFHSGAVDRVVAFYPSPMGATESQLELAAWDRLLRENPILTALEPDVEALLVNRARGARQFFLVPVDECYRLVGLIRSRWRGLSGGREVWDEIEAFFTALSERAEPAGYDKEGERWQRSA